MVAAIETTPRRPTLWPAAVAGIAGPIIFTALVVVQALLNPEYNHLALPISALAAWPSGWIQNINFFVLGVLMVAYAIGLNLGMRQGKGGLIGPALLVVSGLGLLVAGSFPMSRAGTAFVVPPGHLVGAVLSFLGAGIGLVVISRLLTSDPGWRWLSTYTLMTGFAMLMLFLVTFTVGRSPDSPLGPWGGLIQRLTVLLWFACTMILAWRLRRIQP